VKKIIQAWANTSLTRLLVSAITYYELHYMTCKNAPVNVEMRVDANLIYALDELVIFDNAFP
jgi:hypothetical protein